MITVALLTLLTVSQTATAQTRPGGDRVFPICGASTDIAITEFWGPMGYPYRPYYPGTEVSVTVRVENMKSNCVASGGFNVSMKIGTVTLVEQLFSTSLQPLESTLAEVSAPALDPRKATGTFVVTATPAAYADINMADNSVEPWLWLEDYPSQIYSAFDALLSHDQPTADQYLSQAQTNNPNINLNPRYHVLRGWSKALSQDFAGAHAELDTAISYNPACYMAHYHKALAYYYANQFSLMQAPLEAGRSAAYADKLQFPHFSEAYTYEGACISWLAGMDAPGYSHSTAQSLFLGALSYGYRADYIAYLRGVDYGMANQANYSACFNKQTQAIDMNETLARAYFYRAYCSDGMNDGYNYDAQLDLYWFLCLAPEDTEAPWARAVLSMYGWSPGPSAPCLDPDYEP
jgi:tetratricopeptide (TPR) repeat protein